MPFEKKPAGTQRDLTYRFRVRSQVRERIEAKLEWLRSFKDWKNATMSDLLRIAVEEYLKYDGDPRRP
jgi:hypothetical protein